MVRCRKTNFRISVIRFCRWSAARSCSSDFHQTVGCGSETECRTWLPGSRLHPSPSASSRSATSFRVGACSFALAYLVLRSAQSKTDQSSLHCSMRSGLDSPRAWSVSLGMGAEELEQQCVVGLDLCLRKVMTAMVELDETRMCNLLGNQLAQLPWNEEIICGSNQQRRVADTAQAFSGVISDQRVDACRRDFLRRVPGRAAPIKTHLLVQRSLAEHKQPAQVLAAYHSDRVAS